MKSGDRRKETFVLTTPLYYVNDLPHISSAYTTIAVDALARFMRLQGSSVLLIAGTDEHGQKIQRTSDHGRSPQAYCDEITAGFVELWQQMDIQYDRFIRTTAPKHKAIVQEFFQIGKDILRFHAVYWPAMLMSLAFNQVCESILALVTSNKFIDQQAPWKFYKQGQNAAVEQVLYAVLESVRLAAYLLAPIIPYGASKIYKQLDFVTDFANRVQISIVAPFITHSTWGILIDKQDLGEPQPVFQRLELLETV